MIVYEKNNKLNINFENELDNPDIEIGKGEIKLGESEITANSVLPVPEEGDAGKVPTVQNDGSYVLANAGGGAFIVHVDENNVLDKTWQEIYDVASNLIVIKIFNDENGGKNQSLLGTVTTNKGYRVMFADGSEYIASTADDYPVHDL